ncbi:50S ribosomal protein L17 [Christensenellaceae bacterium NSJ-44]|jgi:large subunit ribosomal protein L17|uniref:Large ribosomal subunit protein bL17 n=1 Tax=Luoshenia tenuis TaxID=2763654 RepID=A0A926D2S0_9FIRM|nr:MULTISPECIES: bL17 family ribosomal protein [Clostridia]MBC8529874.1 50S ribosomal protein L17 [Luoshenia tenuis]SCJ65371.1 50S ribosomal protein L17 [uncultured Clostridium sp.]
MSGYRKLNRPADQRKALLRNQVTALLWNGKIETTQARAKEVRAIAEKLITLAVREYDNTLTVTKDVLNDKGQTVPTEFKIDAPSKLHARRQIMAYVYDVQEAKQPKESKSDYKERTADIKHPLVEKMFGEMAPKYAKRKEESGQGGGYVRMLKKGPRRGDAAEMVILELL